jgi:hypothetical protein
MGRNAYVTNDKWINIILEGKDQFKDLVRGW